MKPIIGLEVHVELKTKSKMFCGCSADYFGKEPNTHTCPVCLGLPGALPVPNKTAIDWCIKIGLALNCEIADFSKFDRKNYFYPDLAKGYQISQYDKPFCENGEVILSNNKRIMIRRVHMEEDTGKLIHEGDSSLIDFNRSGVPLVEIVTEPDFENATEVKEYLQKLQQIVRYLEVSNADMEKGDMRLEPNISLSPDGNLPKYKVEVKNINSFSFVEKAINFEIKRQGEILDKGGTPAQETRGWDEKSQSTKSQRLKEEANDYRYFPEPDIPPLNFKEVYIEAIKAEMPELPDAKLARFQKDFGLSYYDAEILTRNVKLADYFEEAIGLEKATAKQIANAIINKKINIEEILPAKLIEMIQEEAKVEEVSSGDLSKIVSEVLSENEKAVKEYKAGKEPALQFLIGQTMKKIEKKIDLNLVKGAILKALEITTP
ncbi:MAG: Asp-tRNA(Asn)/Glu-tRNA(Gln) amidotransferase subunit GatB [Candidatus Levyibacteriota bacterium]